MSDTRKDISAESASMIDFVNGLISGTGRAEVQNISECKDVIGSVFAHNRMLAEKAKYVMEENGKLWAIFRTCTNCKNIVPGILNGCSIQQYIDLSGWCNQREEKEVS